MGIRTGTIRPSTLQNPPRASATPAEAAALLLTTTRRRPLLSLPPALRLRPRLHLPPPPLLSSRACERGDIPRAEESQIDLPVRSGPTGEHSKANSSSSGTDQESQKPRSQHMQHPQPPRNVRPHT